MECVVYYSALALSSSIESEEGKFQTCMCIKLSRHEISIVLVVLTMNMPVF
jgi:hypothetical protein